ncbi:hypothetical protein KR018_000857 [Drosophila ironensis]|nr:hypothetical protein KR018_000857 [Drosophila ironensis]
MNTPGMSLFQGAETLNVNSTLDRQEEEEALQDQKRREEEVSERQTNFQFQKRSMSPPWLFYQLGNLLENAFDDLDDEENTIDSTTNFQSGTAPSDPDPDTRHDPNTDPDPDPYPPTRPHPYPLHDHPQHADELQRLNLLLESKSHELENVNKVATAANKQLDDCRKQLLITQAELERALRDKQNTHELLVETKERCSNQDSCLEKLREDKIKLEEEKKELFGKLEAQRTILLDYQTKCEAMKAKNQKDEERDFQWRVKQYEQQHRAKYDLLQSQYLNVSTQLDGKKAELDQLQVRYNTLQSGHETMLLDKAAKINELNQALDVAQSRCNQLASRPDLEAENERLKQCVSELNARLAALEKTIAGLNNRVIETTTELDLMDTLLQQHQLDDTPNTQLSQVGASRVVGSTPLNPLEKVSHIKQELYRALANLKTKRDEVRRFEKLLEERNQEVRSLRDQENQSLVQLATLKEDKTRLENRVKSLQEELQEVQSHPQLEAQLANLMGERNTLSDHNRQIEEQLRNVEKQLQELRQEHESLEESHRQLQSHSTEDNLRLDLERHKILLKDAHSEVERLKKLYADIASNKESLEYDLKKLRQSDTVMELQAQSQQLAAAQRSLQLAELKSEELSKILEAEKHNHERELQELRQKSEREKREEVAAASKDNSDNCSKCVDKRAEITSLEIGLLKQQTINMAKEKQIIALEQQIKESKRIQAAMANKVELCIQQEALIEDLKEKSKQFEAYIAEQAEKEIRRIRRKSSGSPKSETDSSSTASARGSPKDLSQDRIKRIEQRVRDEMAKLFAAELKKFNIRLQQTEERNQCFQREYKEVSAELQQRQMEVDLLKQTILAEREKIEEMLAEKEKKAKAVLEVCRQELQVKSQRIEELSRESEEHQASIESERKSMKLVMAHWEKQQQSIEQVERKWREQLESMQAAHEEAIRAAQQRYKCAKRTAQNYKLYADEKEAHMKSEYERIKMEYETSLSNIEKQVSQRFSHRSRDRYRDKENQPINGNTRSNAATSSSDKSSANPSSRYM